MRKSLTPHDYQQFDDEYQRLLTDYSQPVTQEFLRAYWREWKVKNKV